MRNLLAAVSSVALLFGVAVAQQTPSPEPQVLPSNEQPNRPTEQGQSAAQPSLVGANHLKIAPGSVIPVQLSKTVDAKKAKTGDEVVATVTQDMKTNSGDVLVPKDTKVIGHVTEVQPRNKEQKQSELGIAFDRAVIKGDQTQLPMSIQAVIAPPSSSNNADAGGPEQPPSAPAGNSPSAPMAGPRPGGMGGGSSNPPQQNYPPRAGGDTSESQPSALPPITGATQGVIGISDVKLESASQNSQQGSVLTSEKNNVKIEKGTLLLLRVSQ
ncbi:MAG TPA: hypothetical protein VMG82_01190 [Candidatus Sulfotelmatobacter sp.]|nr:hypothetical protein [Candidatus Sulfotelmatobacter sp.]